MKHVNLLIFLLLFISCNNGNVQKNNSEQINDTLEEIGAVQNEKIINNLVLKLTWDSTCCSTIKYPEGNLGIAGFAIINSNEIAILCEVDSLIKIYEMYSSTLLKEIKLTHSFREIGYSNWTKCFYLTNRNKLYEYSYNNESSRIIDINKKIEWIIEVVSIDSDVYCITSSNESYKIISKGIPLSEEEQLNSKIEGVIINSDTYVNFKKHNLNIEVTEYSKDKSYIYNYKIEEESSAFKLIGANDGEFIFVKYLNRIKERKNYIGTFTIFSKKDTSVLDYAELPNIYYTSILNNIKSKDKRIYHLITTPKEVLIFEIEYDKLDEFSYPDFLDYDFHFNTDL